jgi:hypothetical protein
MGDMLFLGGPFKLSKAKFACRIIKKCGIDFKRGGYALHRRLVAPNKAINFSCCLKPRLIKPSLKRG